MYQLILGWVKLPMKLPCLGEISGITIAIYHLNFGAFIVCELLLLRVLFLLFAYRLPSGPERPVSLCCCIPSSRTHLGLAHIWWLKLAKMPRETGYQPHSKIINASCATRSPKIGGLNV